MPGFALGPTFACITVDQMKRWRQADRFWYENDQHPGAFNLGQFDYITVFWNQIRLDFFFILQVRLEKH